MVGMRRKLREMSSRASEVRSGRLLFLSLDNITTVRYIISTCPTIRHTGAQRTIYEGTQNIQAFRDPVLRAC